MPIYEYECRSCGSRTEALQRLHDPALSECDECGGELRKLLSAPAFQFKGSGWYVTDYARKGETGDKEKSSGKDGDGAGQDSSPKDASSKSSEKSSEKSSSGTSATAATDKTTKTASAS